MASHEFEGDPRRVSLTPKERHDPSCSGLARDTGKRTPTLGRERFRGQGLVGLRDLRKSASNVVEFETLAPEFLSDRAPRLPAFGMARARDHSCKARVIDEADLAIALNHLGRHRLGDVLPEKRLPELCRAPGRGIENPKCDLPGTLGLVRLRCAGEAPTRRHGLLNGAVDGDVCKVSACKVGTRKLGARDDQTRDVGVKNAGVAAVA